MIELLTSLLVIITGVYAYFTYRILRANERVVGTIQEQINSSVRPYVYFDLVTDGPLIIAKIKNTGLTAAHDVSVNIDPKLLVTLHGRTFDARITSTLITLMPPGKEIEEFIESYSAFEKENPSLKYKGNLSYRDVNGRDYMESFEIDLSIRKDLTYIGRPNIPNEIKKMNDHLSKISSNLEAFLRRQDETSG